MAERDSVFGVAIALTLCCLWAAACGSSGAGSAETAADVTPPSTEEPVTETTSASTAEPVAATTEDTDSNGADSAVMVESLPPIEVVPEVAPEEEPAPAPDEEEPEDGTVVVIDTGAKDLTQKPVSLVEAARAERARRGAAPPTEIVITDKNLAEYATGELTTMAETTDPEAAALAEELSAEEKKRAEEEAFWRSGALEIRQAWRDAYDRVEELEGKVFELRQEFYREDDGFYRDSEIKPAWDRAIEELEEARAEVKARQQELVEFTDRGREAGALPGWLREGIELEPPLAQPQPDPAEPSEPVIYEPEASDPP